MLLYAPSTHKEQRRGNGKSGERKKDVGHENGC
jgi:hypothetical protein